MKMQTPCVAVYEKKGSAYASFISIINLPICCHI